MGMLASAVLLSHISNPLYKRQAASLWRFSTGCCLLPSKVLIYLGFVLPNLDCAAPNSRRTTVLSGQTANGLLCNSGSPAFLK